MILAFNVTSKAFLSGAAILRGITEHASRPIIVHRRQCLQWPLRQTFILRPLSSVSPPTGAPLDKLGIQNVWRSVVSLLICRLVFLSLAVFVSVCLCLSVSFPVALVRFVFYRLDIIILSRSEQTYFLFQQTHFPLDKTLPVLRCQIYLIIYLYLFIELLFDYICCCFLLFFFFIYIHYIYLFIMITLLWSILLFWLSRIYHHTLHMNFKLSIFLIMHFLLCSVISFS